MRSHDDSRPMMPSGNGKPRSSGRTGQPAVEIFEQNILRYVTETKRGKAFFRKILRDKYMAAEGKGQDVLILLYPDGWVEVYSHRSVRVHFYSAHPYCRPTASGVLQRKAMELFELVVPERIRRLLAPNATPRYPGMVNYRQVKLMEFDGKPVFQWVLGDNRWQDLE